ncbi:hypothetical protein [Streptomyces sannanensis]|uniref:hypothetical protein n=1 Tax=Streptomyces sannanensis TaxID=285536 RepID=UPI0031EB99A6
MILPARPAGAPSVSDVAALSPQTRAMFADGNRTTFVVKRKRLPVLLGFATAACVSELVALDFATVTEADHGYDVTLYRAKVRKHTPNPCCCRV